MEKTKPDSDELWSWHRGNPCAAGWGLDNHNTGRNILRACDIQEWEQGCYRFKTDLFFSIRIISFYTINTLKREREISRTSVVRGRPLVWFHLLQNVNATRDFIYYKTWQWKKLLTAKRDELRDFKIDACFHVINNLLLTEEHDSIIDCKTRIFKHDSVIDSSDVNG